MANGVDVLSESQRSMALSERYRCICHRGGHCCDGKGSKWAVEASEGRHEMGGDPNTWWCGWVRIERNLRHLTMNFSKR